MGILAADIGNSTITIGLLKGAEIDIYRISSGHVLEPAEYRDKLQGFMDISRAANANGSVICSVVPEVVEPLADALEEITGCEPLVADNSTASGLELEVENSETLGTDRVASAVGALQIADPPIAFIDFGTATTVNFIDPGPGGQAIFRGGAIMPGLGLMGHALASNTSQLPRVEQGGVVRLPGRNTEDSILAGITYATAGGVERILEEVEQVSGLKYRIIVTGGMLEYAAAFIRRPTRREPALTLRGLFSMYEQSRGL
jgi:type III pantothenate kinase